MAKKNAPKRGASRTPPPAPSQRQVPGWLWLACGLAIGGFAMSLARLEPGSDAIRRDTTEQPLAKAQQPSKPKYDFYTLLPESEVVVPQTAQQQPAQPVQAQKPPEPPQPATQPTPPPQPPATAQRPPAKLTPAQDTARAEALLNGRTPPAVSAQPPALAKAAPATHYYLQAGSFRSRTDAESTKARIALLGQSVRIEIGSVRGETWHRVVTGPFTSRQQLEQAQRQLAGDGFRNVLTQQRQSR